MSIRERKVVVIGLDGGTLDLIGPWANEGKLPNMSRIMENGFRGYLTSAFPPITPTAWASFITGKNPGKHGILDFDLSLGNGYDRTVVNATNIDAPTLWSILSEAGKKIGVVHVPLTYPPEKVNGFIVCGYALSPSISTYPKNLAKELFSMVPGYKKVYSDILLVTYIPTMEDSYIEEMHYATKTEAEVVYYLLEKYEWDFLIAHFYFMDQVQHNLWKYMDSTHPLHDMEGARKYGEAILEYHQLLDSIIGKIRGRIDANTTLFVMSDHGFGPVYKRVFVNHWLKKIGLLELKSESKPSSSPNALSKLGLTRDKLAGLVGRHNALKLIMKIIPRRLTKVFYWSLPLSTLTLKDIDYSRTQAYSTGCAGQIFINLKGKHPEGIVEPGEEYEHLRNFIIKELYELKDSAGEKIVDKVWKKEEMYWGPHLEKAADILFIMKNLSYITLGSAYSPWEFGPDLETLTGSPRHLSGWHRMNGVLMGIGPDLRKGAILKDARIIDLAPTILHILDVPVPSDMDGRVLREIFKPESSLYRHVHHQVLKARKEKEYALTDMEKKDIEKKLKALGYV